MYNMQRQRNNNYENISSSIPHGGDLKLLSVPVVFLLLRIWSTVIDNIVYYTNEQTWWSYYLKSPGIAALVIMAVSIRLQNNDRYLIAVYRCTPVINNGFSSVCTTCPCRELVTMPKDWSTLSCSVRSLSK